uniref:EOG090X0DHL n=1 Tax=Alona affinis TaxID=381656 RepID=A0A9N6WSV1_9CRUS|nr:EOG090X0DHL [Alona affinis]
MFVLTLIRQTVRVPADKFKLAIDQAIAEELNLKFANKVVLNVGLCIALWDITKRGKSFILPSDSGHHTKVELRLVVFRPFLDEILVGKIKSCNKDHVQVTLSFFDDIFIPAEYLPDNSKFVEEENLWAWVYQNDGGTHEMFMEIGADIRFKVMDEMFLDTTPTGPGVGDSVSADAVPKENKQISYRITGSIKDPGLGLLSWWMADDTPEDE